ncbi:MAG: ABC transporter substrate-binding protein [Deltaproteobacteria bacterium]|nr:ABC transporter substrate-binding protein [Deltaproteobacteria bacterium]
MTPKLNKFKILAGLCLSLTLFLGVLGGNNFAQTPAPPASDSAKLPEGEFRVLKVPMPSEPSSPDLVVVGDDLGIFQKRGLKMDFIGTVPTPQYVAAVVSGRIDVSPGSHINRTIAGISAGAKILAVAGKTESTERVPHMIGIVPKSSPIKEAKDLIGKKIGIPTIGGCNEYTPYAWLGKNGVTDPKTKVEVIVLPEKNLEQVLRQGEIDLAMIHKVPSEIVRQGEFKIIFSDYDVWGSDGGQTPFYFSTEFIKKEPETVRAFVASIAEIVNWANANPDETRAITAKRTNTSFDYVNERYYSPNAIIRPETAQVWIDLLTSYGEIKPGITLEQIYTNEFNPYYKQAN